MLKMKTKTLTILTIILLSFTYASLIESDSYSIEKNHLGLSGENSSSDSYELRSTTTYQQAGDKNLNSTNYKGSAGWFETISYNETISEETPVTPPTPGSPGGGGSSGGSTTTPVSKEKFSVDKELIKISTKVGETFKVSLKIKNLGSEESTFSLESNLKDKLIFSEEKFSIKPQEEKTIELTFYSTKEVKPDVYPGEISISSQGEIKKIPIIFEIESKQVLFDISLDIPSKYKEIFPGEDLLIQLTLFNLGEVGKVDVSVNYVIKDFEGNTISENDEMIAVETQASFSRTIKLPSGIKPGEYVVATNVKYGNSVGTSSNIFRVKGEEKSKLWNNSLFLALIGIIIIIIVIIIIFEYEHRKLGSSIKKYNKQITQASKNIKTEEKKAIINEKENQKINAKLGVLKKAYKQGHISKQAYNKTTSRLKGKLR
jgi:Sec-independent protein translocase protein TatA